MSNTTEDKFLIIDTDCGVDDAEALIFVFSQLKSWHLLGVTCVGGNTGLDNVAGNVLRVLRVCHKAGKDIPVFKGAADPLCARENLRRPSHAHGDDGLGGIASSIPIDESEIQTEHAVNWLVKTVKEFPNQVTLVTLGPLTNVALAVKMCDGFKTGLKRLCVMGGNHKGESNVENNSAEFNFGCDPEAASIVLSEIRSPINLMTWEACKSNYLPWEWHTHWLSANSMKANFIQRMTAAVVKRRMAGQFAPGYFSCDLFAMVAFLCGDEVVNEQKAVSVLVELSGTFTRGQCVVDWLGNVAGKEPNANLILSLDSEKLKTYLETMLL